MVAINDANALVRARDSLAIGARLKTIRCILINEQVNIVLAITAKLMLREKNGLATIINAINLEILKMVVCCL